MNQLAHYLAASSKANFMVWMAGEVEQLRARYGWTDRETEDVAHLLMAARDTAIEEMGEAMEDLGSL
jgi:hypothetical protein